MTPVALTIAGSDPSGGAGIQADLKTFHQRGVYGMSVITLITVQNTERMEIVEPLKPSLVLKQLDILTSDIPPNAAKTGALGTGEIIEALAERVRNFSFPLIVDPVFISKHDMPLLDPKAQKILVRLLFPRAFLVTPNLQEARILSGRTIEKAEHLPDAARAIADSGAHAVLIKGGHLEGDAVDVLYFQNKIYNFRAPRIRTVHTHGTGCTYSAAITAEIAKGRQLPEAVEIAKQFITKAIETGPRLGKGAGPVNHQAII